MDAKHIYPPISLDEIRDFTAEVETQFVVSRVINPLPQKNCFSASFFKKNPNNTYADQYPVDETVFAERYTTGLTKIIKRLPQLGLHYKLRIYLADDLGDQAPHLIELCPQQVEIHLMQSSSVGFGPGSLWRFLALGDMTLDIVGMIDIDSPIDTMLVDALQRSDSAISLCKLPASLPTLHVKDGLFWGQYHAFQAGTFAMRPVHSLGNSLNIWPAKPFIKSAICGFIQYAVDRRFRNDSITIFNVPRPGHPEGWGRHPYIYGIDETFLKCVLYPLFATTQVIFVGGSADALELSLLRSD